MQGSVGASSRLDPGDLEPILRPIVIALLGARGGRMTLAAVSEWIRTSRVIVVMLARLITDLQPPHAAMQCRAHANQPLFSSGITPAALPSMREPPNPAHNAAKPAGSDVAALCDADFSWCRL